MFNRQPTRRRFLKAAGVCIALPALESVRSLRAAEGTHDTAPRRVVCVGNEFGMYPGTFWPEGSGADYELSPRLEPLAPHRDQFTLSSHLDHGLKGGHFAVHGYLTGVKSQDARNMPEGGISLDQRAAEFVGARTRFPSLTIGSDDGLHGGCQMSWTRTGTRVPPIPGPRELFRALFVEDDADEKLRAADRIALQGSILDGVLGDAKSLERTLNAADRLKLQEYLASIRSVETKLELDRNWQRVPKPKVDREEPRNQGLANDLPAIYDLIALALQTDSTRVATLEIAGSFQASDIGVRSGYHGLSHHGHRPEALELLAQIEAYQMQEFARFLERLRTLRQPGSDASLLDSTMVLLGSGMGNANSHTNTDLPILLAGGGFRHGRHEVYPEESRRRVPLCNLFVSMLQRFGVETDTFGISTGTLNGLEA
jgi:hypothetical protein